MALLIKPNNTSEVVTPSGVDGKFTLEELQELVGGYIEVVKTLNEIMIINEEGLPLKLPKNEIATMMCKDLRIGPDYIYGNALLVEENEIE